MPTAEQYTPRVLKRRAKPADLIAANTARAILLIRDQRVIIDADLAQLYGVPTKALNQAVKRNPDRFPPDFMFRLTRAEKKELVTHCDHLQSLKFSPVLPRAFTEHGAIMAASVLSSPRAVKVSVEVVRAFVRLRALLAQNEELARRLAALESRTDAQFKQVYGAIQMLMDPPEEPEPKKPPIGFRA